MDFSENGSKKSKCGNYRYVQWVDVGDGDKGVCTVIGTIPFTKQKDGDKDQTFEVCKAFAKKSGYSTLVEINLFAIAPKDPTDLKVLSNPIGPKNDSWILKVAAASDIIIAGWGDLPRIGQRAREVLKLLLAYDIYAVQTNANGTPTHPLAWQRQVAKIYRRRAPVDLPNAG